MAEIKTLATVASQDVVCVNLEVHLWSARIQLRAEDLQKFSASLSDLPDSALASMGSVKLCDPEVIRRFERLKREAQVLLEAKGLPLFGIRAVPAAKFDEVRAALDEIKLRFSNEALQLFTNYDKVIGEWRDAWSSKNPGYTHLLDRIPKAEAVFGKLSFDYHAYKVEPPKGVDDIDGDFSTKLTGLRGELYADAAREATLLIEEYFVKDGCKRDYITPRTLGPFKRIANRFRDFSFLDPAAIAAADLIDATVGQALAYAQADKRNRITDGQLMLVWSMAHTFANPSTAAALAEKSFSQGNQSAWDHLMGLGGISSTVKTAVENHIEQPQEQLTTDSGSLFIEQLVEPQSELSEIEQFESSLYAMQKCVANSEIINVGTREVFSPDDVDASNEVGFDTNYAVPAKASDSIVTGIDMLFNF